MLRHPPRLHLSDPHFPYTTLFRSAFRHQFPQLLTTRRIARYHAAVHDRATIVRKCESIPSDIAVGQENPFERRPEAFLAIAIQAHQDAVTFCTVKTGEQDRKSTRLNSSH